MAKDKASKKRRREAILRARDTVLSREPKRRAKRKLGREIGNALRGTLTPQPPSRVRIPRVLEPDDEAEAKRKTRALGTATATREELDSARRSVLRARRREELTRAPIIDVTKESDTRASRLARALVGGTRSRKVGSTVGARLSAPKRRKRKR